MDLKFKDWEKISGNFLLAGLGGGKNPEVYVFYVNLFSSNILFTTAFSQLVGINICS